MQDLRLSMKWDHIQNQSLVCHHIRICEGELGLIAFRIEGWKTNIQVIDFEGVENESQETGKKNGTILFLWITNCDTVLFIFNAPAMCDERNIASITVTTNSRSLLTNTNGSPTRTSLNQWIPSAMNTAIWGELDFVIESPSDTVSSLNWSLGLNNLWKCSGQPDQDIRDFCRHETPSPASADKVEKRGFLVLEGDRRLPWGISWAPKTGVASSKMK
jgi:hypothetical protein